MKKTPNFQFNKPELTDSPPDITVWNPNFDTIDTKLKEFDEHKADNVAHGVATPQEAIEGVSDEVYVTPFTVKEAIKHLDSVKVVNFNIAQNVGRNQAVNINIPFSPAYNPRKLVRLYFVTNDCGFILEIDPVSKNVILIGHGRGSGTTSYPAFCNNVTLGVDISSRPMLYKGGSGKNEIHLTRVSIIGPSNVTLQVKASDDYASTGELTLIGIMEVLE